MEVNLYSIVIYSFKHNTLFTLSQHSDDMSLRDHDKCAWQQKG